VTTSVPLRGGTIAGGIARSGTRLRPVSAAPRIMPLSCGFVDTT
jgi:hypothetical protein